MSAAASLHLELTRGEGGGRIAPASTEGGFATRELYTNKEEPTISAARPLILNGIGEFTVRGDILRRCVTVELPVISKRARKFQREADRARSGG